MKDAGLPARRTQLPGRFYCVLLPEPGRSYTPRATDNADRKRRRPRFRRVDKRERLQPAARVQAHAPCPDALPRSPRRRGQGL